MKPKGQMEKLKKIYICNFSENIRTNWTGFIRQQTGLICQRIKPVPGGFGSPPVDIASSFSSFKYCNFSPLKCLLFVSRDRYIIRISIQSCSFWNPLLIFWTNPLIEQLKKLNITVCVCGCCYTWHDMDIH